MPTSLNIPIPLSAIERLNEIACRLGITEEAVMEMVTKDAIQALWTQELPLNPHCPCNGNPLHPTCLDELCPVEGLCLIQHYITPKLNQENSDEDLD